MKLVIRRGVFETNSSSTHSVTMTKGSIKNSSLYVDPEDNKVHVEFGKFGWGYDELKAPIEKLSYICTLLAEIEGQELSCVENLYKTKGFKQINTLIASKYNCEGVAFRKLRIRSYKTGDTTKTYLDIDGYIDHQSREGYSNIDDFLKDWDVSLEEFIFNSEVTVIIDNDNS